MNELKNLKIWICWNYKEKNGKRTKKPCAASGAKTGTDPKHSATWVTYAEAVVAAKKHNYDGIGFIIPEGYFFLDIDHRSMEDELARTLLDRYDTYAEQSVSGDGFHIYGKCDRSRIPTAINENGAERLDSAYYQKNSTLGIELYIGGLTNRYAVFTGNAVKQLPLEDCTAAVLHTLDKEMRRNARRAEATAVPRSGTTDLNGIVSALRSQKNGDKFSRLYDQGDWSAYGSQSEADCALCAMIAFRTGPNPDAVDEVFRGSALYRKKWERAAYRSTTIEAGIRACSGEFHEGNSSAGTPRETPAVEDDPPPFIRFKGRSGEPSVVPALLAKYIRENVPYVFVQSGSTQEKLIYVYRDGVYKLCCKDTMLGLIKAPVEAYDEELVNMSQIREAYQNLMTDLNHISQEQMDSDETVINFNNGLLRVTSEGISLEPHTPKVYSSIQLPITWTEDAEETPVFDMFLETLTNGDPALKELLMEFMGVCLSNVKGWRMKKALFLVGPGDTGKSQLKGLMERLLGKGNYMSIDLKELEARFGTGNIFGTRLAGSSDMSFQCVDELKSFKRLTGGDSLFGEIKHLPGFEFTYGGLLWFCMNRLPRFG